jgi:hypothetical protein
MASLETAFLNMKRTLSERSQRVRLALRNAWLKTRGLVSPRT